MVIFNYHAFFISGDSTDWLFGKFPLLSIGTTCPFVWLTKRKGIAWKKYLQARIGLWSIRSYFFFVGHTIHSQNLMKSIRSTLVYRGCLICQATIKIFKIIAGLIIKYVSISEVYNTKSNYYFLAKERIYFFLLVFLTN